jgi:predicted Zn finger-like uncharacterized protein
MSLKTRCPACDTVFKIVPDQLKVSKGWVRCGRCAEVFDAAAHAAAPDEANPWPQTSPPETIAKSTVATSSLTNAASSTTAIDFAKDAAFTPENIANQAINTPATAIFDTLNAKIAENKRDFESRFRKTQLLMAQQRWTEAMDELLEILMRDKTWNEDQARKTYIAILDIIEPAPVKVADGQIPPVDATVATYRRRLSSVVLS